MTLRATPITAALTGAISAVLWPLAWSRFGGAGASFSMELMLATLLLIALPAHAFVVGFGYRHAPAAGKLDVALLQRLGAWLLAAAVTAAVMAAAR
ncbi:hypothetical protein H8N03_24420 [Ramlibacter sp. USB13]|uniref:Uncharacterized protein n=1 Tax=Ramlibacter cellulosilyticus TaxID=2764187 RepID=A0A923MW02_9BURK|nr:hypothetical protein [Ramlibacter cellulosilyticus]MBC5786106.1 hypothetical protein [Ramlibacter cellulosilyticus]